MSLSAARFSLASSKEGRDAMLKRNMDIYRLIVYVQKIEEENMRDREEYIHKKAKTRNEFGQQKGDSNGQKFKKQK